MKCKITLCTLLFAICGVSANANWEYNAPAGHYQDDGSRVTISIRGGAAFGSSSMKNELGTLVPEPYWYDATIGIMTETYCGGAAACAALGYTNLGQIDIGQLPVNKKFESLSFAGGMGVGLVLPHAPQWRAEVAWDHISKSDYNSTPMFKGDLVSTTSDVLSVESTGVQSDITTEVFSVMLYHDFFEGARKPLRELIPYIGFGAGYADSITVLNVTDAYGDLSNQVSMQDLGEDTGGSTLSFYTSESSSSNIAVLGALGFSYGLDANTFFDVGVRLMWLPKVIWELNNAENTDTTVGFKSRDIFSAENMLYGMITVGLRFEF
ncbi:MAG: hypothetical protein WC137_02800 [Alphaproteobacteria bacterium]